MIDLSYFLKLCFFPLHTRVRLRAPLGAWRAGRWHCREEVRSKDAWLGRDGPGIGPTGLLPRRGSHLRGMRQPTHRRGDRRLPGKRVRFKTRLLFQIATGYPWKLMFT